MTHQQLSLLSAHVYIAAAVVVCACAHGKIGLVFAVALGVFAVLHMRAAEKG
jgi:hypothetical protein